MVYTRKQYSTSMLRCTCETNLNLNGENNWGWLCDGMFDLYKVRETMDNSNLSPVASVNVFSNKKKWSWKECNWEYDDDGHLETGLYL